MADMSLIETSMDISTMNLDWVADTDDNLFKDLSIVQGTVLYFHHNQAGARIRIVLQALRRPSHF
jgi:hypothetical protein